MTSDRDKEFQEFFREWKQKNVVAVGNQRIDPSDRKYMIQRRAQDLKEEARERGFLSLLYEAAGQRDVFLYVSQLFAIADSRERAIRDHPED